MGNKIALIIGNSEYQDPTLARLAAPGVDVRNLAEVLRAPEIGGFGEVTILANETVSIILKAIARFFSQKKPDDLLLLYFSGHGVRDDHGQLYLATKDTEHDLLSGTAVPAAFLTGEMDRSHSRRQVLILDCCHSGAFAQGAKGTAGESIGTGAAFEGTGYGRVVLTASDATQYAWQGEQVIGKAEHSLFTHYLVEGLRTGKADIDGDGRITVDELYDYVYEQVVTVTPKQTPGKWSYKQQGELVVALNPHPAVKPAKLPDDLLQTIEDSRAWVREGAVNELARLLRSSQPGLSLAAREALTCLINDDSRKVSDVASHALAGFDAEHEPAKETQKKLADPQKIEPAPEPPQPSAWERMLHSVWGKIAAGALLVACVAVILYIVINSLPPPPQPQPVPPEPSPKITPGPTPVVPAPKPAVPSPAASDSPMGGYDAQNTFWNREEKTLKPPLAEAWRYRPPEGTCYLDAVTVGSGVALISGMDGDKKNAVFAADMGTGQHRWKFTLYQGLGPMAVSPAIAGDTAFFGGQSDDNLYAIDVGTGAVRKTVAGMSSMYSLSPKIAHGNLYVNTIGRSILAFKVQNLDKIWELPERGKQSQIAVEADVLLQGGVYGVRLMGVDTRSGTVRWETSGAIGSQVTSWDGYAYAFYAGDFTGSGTFPRVAAFRVSDGSKKWDTTMPNYLKYGILAFANGVLYVLERKEQGGTLFALDARDGSIIKQKGFDTPPSAMAIANGVIYVGSYQPGPVLALEERTLNSLWSSAQVDRCSDLVVANGRLYAVTKSSLIAYGNANR
jgi:outer membrane protein assembly factor BamB